MTNPNNWPDPAKPGVPLHPERDGWHWVGNVVREWHAQFQIWQDRHGYYCIPPATWGLLQYGGSCLTPAEVEAREQAARREGMENAAQEVDCGCAIRDAVLERLESQGERRASWLCQRGDVCCALQAAAIRAAAKENIK